MDPITFTFLLGRLGRLTETIATEVCARADLTPAELRVLSLLAHANAGVASPREIARFVVQTSGGLTATLNRLEQQELIERHPDPDDGRGRLVVLTDAGRTRQDEVVRSLADVTVGSFDADLTEIAPHLRSLVESLERTAGLPSSAGFVASPIGSLT
jgi:DNA-binding MarR family transcriptional regulator